MEFTVVSKSSCFFLITFFTALIKAVNKDRTLSSSLTKSVCLMHMKKIYAGRPGNKYMATRGFKSAIRFNLIFNQKKRYETPSLKVNNL